MEGTAVRGRLTWQVATVTGAMRETSSVRTIDLDVPSWPGHRAGQHLDIKLTAEDGYSAERSYSIASAVGEPVAITVERLDDGEVSPYLTEDLQVGDQLEIRGPVGGYFVWEAADGGPLLLVAGGSGIVPLRSILRQHERTGSDAAVRLLYSARAQADLIYRDELGKQRDGVEIIYTLTREQPAGWTGYARRVDSALLAEIAWPAGEKPLAFVCGPTNFVETVAGGLVTLGYAPGRVKTERFGGTGGSALRAVRHYRRTLMDELDGNRAAGLLREIFGREMTVAVATCASCGAVAPIGETGLYMGGPGTVIRCRNCVAVLMVITQIRGIGCVDAMGITALEMS